MIVKDVKWSAIGEWCNHVKIFSLKPLFEEKKIENLDKKKLVVLKKLFTFLEIFI